MIRLFKHIALICLVIPFSGNTQNVHPEIEAMTAELSLWMQKQISTHGYIDTIALDSMNALIREKQKEILALEAVKQDTSFAGNIIYKKGLLGSAWTVPVEKKWKIRDIYCTNEQGMKIRVTSWKYPGLIRAGDKLNIPVYCVEADLISSPEDNFVFEFKIEELPLENNK